MTPKNESLAVQLRSVPQQVILTMTGKQQTVELQRIAAKWGIPIAGRTVDLFSVLRSTCEFLDKHGPMLSLILEEPTDDPDGPLMVELLRARISKLQADARLAELRLAERENLLCDRRQVHEAFGRIASVFQNSASNAQRKWGESGFDFFVELADKMEAEVMPLFVDDAHNADAADPQEDDAEKPSDLA